MKRWTIMALVGMCVALTGCGTFIRLGQNREKDMRYAATRCDAALLSAYWEPSGNGSWNPVSGMWFLSPITLVDMPLAVTVDTVLLPHDWHTYRRNVDAEGFWRATLTSTSALPSVAECVAHCTPYSRSIIDKTVYDDYAGKVTGDTLDLLVRMAGATNENTACISLSGIARHKNLHSSTWLSLYQIAQNGPPNYFLLVTLARSPAMPPEYYPILAKQGSYEVRKSLAVNPSTPPEVLQTLADDARECIRREKLKPSPSWWDVNNSQEIIDWMEKHHPKRGANQQVDGTRP